MSPTVTVVVPALNEAERLPILLDTLDRQTRRPDQVVISDAGSTDDTRAIATTRGAQVVDGGKPAAGRNAGARVATSDLILFLDADDELDDDFIAAAIEEFEDRELSVATAFVDPIERDPQNIFACEVVNLYLDVMQYVAPHAPGFCILVRREVHEAIDGFDETVVLAEDHDYVQRAAEQGKFRILRCFRVGTSMRRIEKEGLVRLAFKYLYCELYVVTGRPIKEVPFDYEFASFEPAERSEARLGIDALRERLGGLADSVFATSADGLETLLSLGSAGPDPTAFDRRLHSLAGGDLKRLRRYVGARARLANRTPKKAIARLRTAGAAIWTGLAGDSEG
jgi:glycosyltransferase involved in cell wall biosynthesis